MTQENVKGYTVDDKVVLGFYVVLFFDVLPHEKKVDVSQEFNDRDSASISTSAQPSFSACGNAL